MLLVLQKSTLELKRVFQIQKALPTTKTIFNHPERTNDQQVTISNNKHPNPPKIHPQILRWFPCPISSNLVQETSWMSSRLLAGKKSSLLEIHPRQTTFVCVDVEDRDSRSHSQAPSCYASAHKQQALNRVHLHFKNHSLNISPCWNLLRTAKTNGLESDPWSHQYALPLVAGATQWSVVAAPRSFHCPAWDERGDDCLAVRHELET